MSSTNYGPLVQSCVHLINTFDAENIAVDTHVQEFFLNNPCMDESEQTFVMEVFAGCVQYDGVLSVVTRGFYNRVLEPSSGQNVYKVLAYLALFRLQELGVSQFKKFVVSQNIRKVYPFLNFFLDEKNLITWMKDEWNKLYDSEYVQSKMLSPILTDIPKLQKFVGQMRATVENGTEIKKNCVPPTVPEPFNIVPPKPKGVPMPQQIPKMEKVKPVPKTTYVEPRESKILNKLKIAHKEEAQMHMHQSAHSTPYANSAKSERTMQRMQEIIDAENSKLHFRGFPSRPIPEATSPDNFRIKLNAATIMREGLLYKKREEEEIKKITRLERGDRDASEFLAWQSRMKQLDTEKLLADIEARRLGGLLTQEEAILARQRLYADNKDTVARFKQEAERLMNEYMQRKLMMDAENKRVVEQVMDGRKNMKEGKKRMQDYKAKIVQQMIEENKELMRQALEEAEIEMRQRLEVISEIRAMQQRAATSQPKLVDLTTTAGLGLLCEMSIVELRERLSLLKLTATEEQDKKRDEIIAEKQSKERVLLDTLDTISRHRMENSRAGAARFEERKTAHSQRYNPPHFRNEKLFEMERQLEVKRMERKQIQYESKMRDDKESRRRQRELAGREQLAEETRLSQVELKNNKTVELCTTYNGATMQGKSRAALLAM